MGDLTRFCKPTFWLFRMESLCIRLSHVMIYFSRGYYFTRLDIVHLLNTDQCYVPISVFFGVNFACLISNFVSVIVLSAGFNFHMVSESFYIDLYPLLFLFQVRYLDWECILLTVGHSFWATDQYKKIILNPFNLFEWKYEMEIFFERERSL